MKKVIFWFGRETILGDWKCIWHLRPGDVIKSEYDPSDSVKMKGRRLVIEGFKRTSDHRFFVWARPEERKRVIGFYKPEGLILKARPGLKFAVGDMVRNKEIPGKYGMVIVICPEKRRKKRYLVEYFNAHTGYGSRDQYKKPWFPKEFKDPKMLNREWRSEEILTPFL